MHCENGCHCGIQYRPGFRLLNSLFLRSPSIWCTSICSSESQNIHLSPFSSKHLSLYVRLICRSRNACFSELALNLMDPLLHHTTRLVGQSHRYRIRPGSSSHRGYLHFRQIRVLSFPSCVFTSMLWEHLYLSASYQGCGDEADQHLRSRSSVRRGRGVASPSVGRFSRSLERNRLRAPPTLRRSRHGRMGDQRVSRALRRHVRRFDGATDQTEEPRSVAVVLRARNKGRSQRQARLLGQRRGWARTSNVHLKHVVFGRMGRILSPLTPRWKRPERGIRTRTAGTPPARSPGRTQLGGVRQARSARTVLRRNRTDIQGLSASHNRHFSPGTTTGFGRSRSGHRCEQSRRLYDYNRPTAPLRRARLIRPLPRNHTSNRRASVEVARETQSLGITEDSVFRTTSGQSIQQQADSTPVPTTDSPTRPRPRRSVSRSHRTPVRRGCFDGICRGLNRRSRNLVVGSGERQDAQLLGVPRVREAACVYRRGVRHNGRSSLRSVDFARVPAVRFDGSDHAASRLVNVCVRLRRPCRLNGKRDVPEMAQRRSTADGTARAIQVGQSRVEFNHRRPAKPQRTAYKPASCLRGLVSETPSVRKPRRSRRGGCHENGQVGYCNPDGDSALPLS